MVFPEVRCAEVSVRFEKFLSINDKECLRLCYLKDFRIVKTSKVHIFRKGQKIMTRSSNFCFAKLNLEISSNFRCLLRIYELYQGTYLSKELGNQKKASVPVDWVWQFFNKQ